MVNKVVQANEIIRETASQITRGRWVEPISMEKAEEEEPAQECAQGTHGSQRSVCHQDQGKVVV